MIYDHFYFSYYSRAWRFSNIAILFLFTPTKHLVHKQTLGPIWSMLNEYGIQDHRHEFHNKYLEIF